MKTVFVLLACAFVCVSAGSEGAGTESSEARESLQQLSEVLKTKFNITFVDDVIRLLEKVEEKCPDLDTKVESAIDDVASCVDNIELGSDTFCQLIRKNFGKCTKPIRQIVIDCLPPESRDLPMIGEKIMAAVIDQICNSTVEEMLELFNPCVMEKELDELAQCGDIKSTFIQHKNELPSKSLICGLVPKAKNCERAILQASCKNPITKQANIQFYEAIEDAIHGECESLNKT